MKVFLKVIAILVLIFGGFAVLGGILGPDREAEMAEIEKRHCELDWQTANDSIKRVTLNEFIDHGGINPVGKSVKTPSLLAAELLPQFVKYPETVKIDGDKVQGYISLRSGVIEDLESGVVRYSKNFTAKNKLSMDVRSRFQMTVKYQAGCKNFQLVDFKVE